ncbi:MAG: hypothetical protein WCV92_04405 [Candidatus Buchananbacteria bacterium]|jgi:hypothetical protein
MLINSSLDILWLAIAAVVVWIGIWLGLSAFHLAMVAKDARHVISSIKKKMELVDQIFSIFKRKADGTAGTAAFIPPLVEGVTKLVKTIRETKEKDKKHKSKK